MVDAAALLDVVAAVREHQVLPVALAVPLSHGGLTRAVVVVLVIAQVDGPARHLRKHLLDVPHLALDEQANGLVRRVGLDGPHELQQELVAQLDELRGAVPGKFGRAEGDPARDGDVEVEGGGRA